MQTTANTNRKETESQYTSRTIRRNGEEIVIVERKPEVRRVGAIEI
jgi:hypothetical protein